MTMGYTTEFEGSFRCTPALSAKQVLEIDEFTDTRHGAADVEPGKPSMYCQWVASSDGETIEWDGGEKFYSYVEWLQYLIDHFLRRWGVRLDGEVRWFGEDRGDIGLIAVVDNVVTTKTGRVTFE